MLQVLWGINGTTDGAGYVSVAWPDLGGGYHVGDALFLMDCSSCTSGQFSLFRSPADSLVRLMRLH